VLVAGVGPGVKAVWVSPTAANACGCAPIVVCCAAAASRSPLTGGPAISPAAPSALSAVWTSLFAPPAANAWFWVAAVLSLGAVSPNCTLRVWPVAAPASTTTGTRTVMLWPAPMEAVVTPPAGTLTNAGAPGSLYCSVPGVPGPATVAEPGMKTWVGSLPTLVIV